MILNFCFISLISSCASMRFLLYRLRSERTCSYLDCCATSSLAASSICFCRSPSRISAIFFSRSAPWNLTLASDASSAKRSRSLSRRSTSLVWCVISRLSALSSSAIFVRTSTCFAMSFSMPACCVRSDSAFPSMTRFADSTFLSSDECFSRSLAMAWISCSRPTICRCSMTCSRSMSSCSCFTFLSSLMRWSLAFCVFCSS
mmetsp:Transcript_11441/g.35563  ORF Transcript_11441/g.35563 Transcript_11441/m.35563 type:complete len:202 (-) Transcript_11441:1044-1649(-)